LRFAFWFAYWLAYWFANWFTSTWALVITLLEILNGLKESLLVLVGHISELDVGWSPQFLSLEESLESAGKLGVIRTSFFLATNRFTNRDTSLLATISLLGTISLFGSFFEWADSDTHFFLAFTLRFRFRLAFWLIRVVATLIRFLWFAVGLTLIWIALTVGFTFTVGVAVALTVGITFTVGVAVALTVGITLTVGVALTVAITFTVGVALTVGFTFTVRVALTVGFTFTVRVVIALTVGIGITFTVGLAVGLAVRILVRIIVTFTVRVTIWPISCSLDFGLSKHWFHSLGQLSDVVLDGNGSLFVSNPEGSGGGGQQEKCNCFRNLFH
jgi:hypothetical protein